MRHVVVTRFSVPRPHDPVNAGAHLDSGWLERRLQLFRSIFVPSLSRFDVPVILLCSTESAAVVGEAVHDLSWVGVEVQNDWYGGWNGASDQIVTRMDSDDGLHQRWFEVVEAAPGEADVYCTKSFLRFDPANRRLCRYWRPQPSPLAAFRPGINPFARDHASLERHYKVHVIKGAFLLQVYHGGNISTRRPSWYRPRRALGRLADYGIDLDFRGS